MKAVNQVGEGEPLQTRHPILVKDDISKPDADLSALYMGSINAKAASNIALKLPLLGTNFTLTYVTVPLNLCVAQANQRLPCNGGETEKISEKINASMLRLSALTRY